MKNINKKVTSNKTRHIEINKKLDDLTKKVKPISIKGLTEDLINKYSILNGAKYFSLDGLQKYIVFWESQVQFAAGMKVYSWKSTGMSHTTLENTYV